MHGKKLTQVCDGDAANVCDPYCLDKNTVKGKIVLCDAYEGAEYEALRSGALGAILRSDTVRLPSITPIFSLSGSIFSTKDYDSIISYYSNTT